MRNFSAYSRVFFSLLLILAIIGVNFLSFLLMSVIQAQAAQLSSRSITLGSSKISTANTYSVSFKAATATIIKGIVVDFANSTCGPLIGTACSGANHPVTGVPTSGTIVVSGGGFSNTNYTAQNPSVNSGKVLQITSATGATPNTTNAITFSFTATNPSAVGTFYAKIITYSTTADATSYDPTTGGSATNPGSNVDDQGSVALSTANEITVQARVNEILQFCVGTTTVDDATTTIATNCGAFTGACANTTVNLGTLDPAYISTTPVSSSFTAGSPSGGNACNGAAQLRTNASLGAVVNYFAEQDTSSGKLKVAGAACSGSSNVDQCFNDSSSQATFTAGTENFGMTVAGTNCNGTTTPNYSCTLTSGTNQLKATSGYIGATATSYGSSSGFAWLDTGSTAQIASSTGPVDDETLVLKFAATPSITTPTGSYQVVSNYIATATF